MDQKILEHVQAFLLSKYPNDTCTEEDVIEHIQYADEINSKVLNEHRWYMDVHKVVEVNKMLLGFMTCTGSGDNWGDSAPEFDPNTIEEMVKVTQPVETYITKTTLSSLSILRKSEGNPEVTGNLLNHNKGILATIAVLEETAAEIQTKIDSLKDESSEIVDGILAYLIETESTGISTFSGSVVTKKNPPRLIVDDLALIPKKFIKATTVFKPIAADIKKSIKASGSEVAGCHLEQTIALKIT